ncbi:hypothetical protein X975_04014, partial [Stegodyphus mimosarum]
MLRINLLSLLLTIGLLLLSNFGRLEAQGASHAARQYFDDSKASGYQQYLENILKDRQYQLSLPPSDMEFLNALRKRQIRYHPCYFNPVSCFRRK